MIADSNRGSPPRDQHPHAHPHRHPVTLIGLVAGWSALAALVIALAGPGNDGGIAMGAVFAIGPVGGLAGLIAGIWLFRRFGPSDDQDAPLPASRGEDSA